MRERIASMILIVALALPGLSRADGMAFSVTGGSVDVQATEQRAVLWLRDGTWEVHVQPVFQRGQGASAWVVPFPVRPTVSASSADFFDQLELLTSPIFLQVCMEDGSGCGFFCGASDAGGAGAAEDGEISVDVWERGTVGELDYAILSAADGDDLVDWLEAEGFEFPGGAGALLRDYEAEGVFFFVARVAADADPDKPLAPVRFQLSGIDPPSYPLRLTGLGVPPGETLDLTLWVVFPYDTPYAARTHGTAALRDYPRDRAEFDAALDKLFQYEPHGTLALLYGSDSWYPVVDGMLCWMDCFSYEELGLSTPDPWSDEVLEMAHGQQWMYRFQARLDAQSMSQDFELQPLPEGWWLEWTDNVYVRYSCSADSAALGGALVVLVGFGLFLGRRRGDQA